MPAGAGPAAAAATGLEAGAAATGLAAVEAAGLEAGAAATGEAEDAAPDVAGDAAAAAGDAAAAAGDAAAAAGELAAAVVGLGASAGLAGALVVVGAAPPPQAASRLIAPALPISTRKPRRLCLRPSWRASGGVPFAFAGCRDGDGCTCSTVRSSLGSTNRASPGRRPGGVADGSVATIRAGG